MDTDQHQCPITATDMDQCHRLVTDMDQRRCHVTVDMDQCQRHAMAMDMDQSQCPITIMDISQYRVAMATVQHPATAMNMGQCRVPHIDWRRVTNGPLRGQPMRQTVMRLSPWGNRMRPRPLPVNDD